MPDNSNSQLLAMTDSEFEGIRNLVYSRFGICLTEQKKTLVVGRLQSLIKEKNFGNIKTYCDYVEKDRTGKALDELVNRISTNFTYFNRESDHFEYYAKTVLPEAVHRNRDTRDLRVWCAGCSTGEEPYTLVILMMEHLGADYRNWSAGVLATDISDKALSKARAGIYTADGVSKLPQKLKNKYFDKDGNNYCVKPEVKKEIVFRRFNLMNTKFPFKKKFDVIFCRNVMIYFDRVTRDALVRRYFDSTVPGGYLFIGHSESLGRDNCPYNYIMPAVYQKV